MSGWCRKWMGSVTEHQEEEKTLEVRTADGQADVGFSDRTKGGIGFSHPASFWRICPLHSQIPPMWASELSYTWMVWKERSLLIPLAAHLCLSSGVKMPIRWDLFTVCCLVWAEFPSEWFGAEVSAKYFGLGLVLVEWDEWLGSALIGHKKQDLNAQCNSLILYVPPRVKSGGWEM